MPSYIFRSQAIAGAKKEKLTNYQTRPHPIDKGLWTYNTEPGVSLAAEWVESVLPEKRDFIASVETGWIRPEGKRVGVVVVTITKDELDELLRWLPPVPANVRFEPLSKELFETAEQRERASATRGSSKSEGGSFARAKSEAVSPVKIVWATADEMKGQDRKAIIEACVAKGVNKSTAQTQLYKWAKANEKT